jgi:hypothetical protein
MQAWDFKLLALNAYGRNADLQACNFPECDALIQNCDDICDSIARNFRGSQCWSSRLSHSCGACRRLGVEKRRHSCKSHMYDYLNDDVEGLEYVRKQSSYLRRLTFSKNSFNEILHLFKEQQAKAENPNQRFYQSIADQIASISDSHSLMVKLVSSPQEGNPNATLMSQRSYDGIYNAFFVPSMQHGSALEKGIEGEMLPRFPVDLYDNEKFAIGQKQDYNHFPTADGKEGGRAIPACSLLSKRSDKSHHFRSLFRVVEVGAQKDGGWNSQRTEAEFTSCEGFERACTYSLHQPFIFHAILQGHTVWGSSALSRSEKSSKCSAVSSKTRRRSDQFCRGSEATLSLQTRISFACSKFTAYLKTAVADAM